MKRMKKVPAGILAMIMLASSCAVNAFAASVDQTSTEALSTAFTFEYKNDPTYTVTIPSAVNIVKDGAPMEIVAEDVAYLDNQKISVTIAGTDKYRNQMLVEGKSADGKNGSIRYQIVKADGTVVETTGMKDQVNGVELASFTENGTATLTVRPVLAASSATIKGVTYTGSMTYGISLVNLD